MAYNDHDSKRININNKIRKALRMINKETPQAIIVDKEEYILWCDVETTGLDEQEKEILEIAAIITKMDGTIVGNPFKSLVHHNNISTVIQKADEIARKMHTNNGLFEELWLNGGDDLTTIDNKIIDWINDNVDKDSILYFGGRSITLDRNFTRVNLPRFYSRITHMSIDLTTLILTLSRNNVIDVESLWVKNSNHRAIDDIQADIKLYQKIVQHLKNN